jgi:hypothetical protein
VLCGIAGNIAAMICIFSYCWLQSKRLYSRLQLFCLLLLNTVCTFIIEMSDKFLKQRIKLTFCVEFEKLCTE